jgi:hypothetical protein
MKTLTSPIKLIEQSIDIFKKKENLVFLIKIFLPLVVFPVSSIIFSYLPFFASNSTSTWFTILMVVIRILYLLVNTFVIASAIFAIIAIIGGEKLVVREVFKKAKKVYFKFLLLNIVLSLSYVLGFALLIVPGVLLVVWLAFARFFMIEKQSGLKASLLKSKELAKGYYWKILLRLIVVGIFGILVEVVLGVIPYGIGSIVWSLLGGLLIIPIFLLYKELSA